MLPLLLLPVLFVLGAALYARGRWKSVVESHSAKPLRAGYTAAEAAIRVLDAAEIRGVNVVENDGFYTNRYDFRTKTLLLSPAVYKGRSAAAVGLAVHEAGHAIQAAEKDVMYPARLTAIGASRFFPGALLLLVIPALFRIIPLRVVLPLIGLGWLALFLWNVSTMPAESAANKLVRPFLKNTGLIRNSEEEEALDETLRAAVWIRAGDFAQALRNFFYHILPLNRGG